jgi:hypothetical protein
VTRLGTDAGSPLVQTKKLTRLRQAFRKAREHDSGGLYLPGRLVRRSSKAIDKTATERAVWRWRTAPDPGLGVPIELGGCQTHHGGEVFVVGEGVSGKGAAAEETPPALDQVQPRSARQRRRG